jgi:hypothetical protein
MLPEVHQIAHAKETLPCHVDARITKIRFSEITSTSACQGQQIYWHKCGESNRKEQKGSV